MGFSLGVSPFPTISVCYWLTCAAVYTLHKHILVKCLTITPSSFDSDSTASYKGSATSQV